MTEVVVFLDHMQVRAGVIRAGLAVAVGVYWSEVFGVFLFLELQLAVIRESRPEPRRSGGEHAVKHVHALNCA